MDRGYHLKRVLLCISIGIISILILYSPIKGSGDKVKGIPPFSEKERLVFNISWLGISAGRAILEISEKMNVKEYLVSNRIEYIDEIVYPENNDVYRIISQAESNRLFSLFYPVNDRIETIIDTEGLYPYYITVHQREGRRKKDKKVIFDQERHLAIMIKGGKEKRYNIPPMVQNSLSCLYYFRTIDNIDVGSSVFMDVHENGKNWKLEIKVLGKEKLNTPVGHVDTLKVKAILRFEGIFINRGDVYVWFTDDEYRIPVLMKGKIIIGSIIARLVSKSP